MTLSRPQWKRNRLEVGRLLVVVDKPRPGSRRTNYSWSVSTDIPNPLLPKSTSEVVLDNGWAATQKAARGAALEAAEAALERLPELKGGES